jgi:hypothetical protein
MLALSDYLRVQATCFYILMSTQVLCEDVGDVHAITSPIENAAHARLIQAILS